MLWSVAKNWLAKTTISVATCKGSGTFFTAEIHSYTDVVKKRLLQSKKQDRHTKHVEVGKLDHGGVDWLWRSPRPTFNICFVEERYVLWGRGKKNCMFFFSQYHWNCFARI